MTRNAPWVLGKLNVLGIFVIVLLLVDSRVSTDRVRCR